MGLWEATDRIGGLMQTEEVDGFVMEQGPSTGTIKYPEVAELFDMLGDDVRWKWHRVLLSAV